MKKREECLLSCGWVVWNVHSHRTRLALLFLFLETEGLSTASFISSLIFCARLRSRVHALVVALLQVLNANLKTLDTGADVLEVSLTFWGRSPFAQHSQR